MTKKIAVVAGGSQNLGKYISEGLVKDSYNKVISLDLVKYNGEEKNVETIICNLYDENQVEKAFEKIENKYGSIQLLVYNTGYTYANKITDYDTKEFIKSFNINLLGYFLTAKYAAKNMLKYSTKGKIIQINSKSGKIGSKHSPGYSAAKAGGVGLTQSMALDLAEHNITVNCLMLGNLLNSLMFESLIPQFAKKLGIKESDVKQHYIEKVPLKRGCEYADVLNCLLFYTSDKADYLTGQSINITGGQIMF